MREPIRETEWASFLHEYTTRNDGRRTRLGVFESRDGVANDYWLEDGLRLRGIDSYTNHGSSYVDIMLETFSHSITNVVSITPIDGPDRDHGLDILNGEGIMTVMRFEDWPARQED